MGVDDSMPARIWERVRSNIPFDLSSHDPLARGHGDPYGEETVEEVAGAEIVFRRPITLEDAGDAVQYLMNHRPVIINLERAEQFEARRVFDFLLGACYALEGSMERLGDGIFLFTPKNQRINVEDRMFLATGGKLLRDEAMI